ncbi:MAG: M48 family metallopeptidase, partial [Bacteroidales bacterium]
FVIGHELGHIKRKHVIKSLLLFPSVFVPFLAAAYSRACEYTCDSIAYSLCPKGVKSGLLVLAAGPRSFVQINSKEFIAQEYNEDGFWMWISEKFSTHPHLARRFAKFKNKIDLTIEPNSIASTVLTEPPSENAHDRYLPKF